MKDEIKEKIDDIFWEVKKHPMDSDYLVKKEEMELLLDYITNLQEENKKLKDYYNDNVNNYEELLEKYSTIQILYNSSKLKNDKAIKYIKEHIRIDDEYPAYMEMLVEEKNELLKILTGGFDE